MRSALILDFFGVICSEIAPFWLADHFSAEDAVRIKSSIVHAADMGEISQDEMFRQLGTLTRLPPRDILSSWRQLAHIESELVNFLKDRRQNFQIGLLTNSPSPFVRSLIDENNLSPLFDKIVVSSEVGMAKPDRRIYQRILGLLGADASNAVMIDDNSLNVEAAVALGMKGILYKSLSSVTESAFFAS